MAGYKEKNFTDRIASANAAKKAALERFKARPGPEDPTVQARMAERQAIAAAREQRKAEREAQLAAEKAAQEAEAKRLAEEEIARAAELEAQRKAARDARYAARKARK